jgi:hypothetical protein
MIGSGIRGGVKEPFLNFSSKNYKKNQKYDKKSIGLNA